MFRISLEIWSVSFVNDFLGKIDRSVSVERKSIDLSEMQRNISRVSELICTQQDNRGTSRSPRKIEKLSGSLAAVL